MPTRMMNSACMNNINNVNSAGMNNINIVNNVNISSVNVALNSIFSHYYQNEQCFI